MHARLRPPRASALLLLLLPALLAGPAPAASGQSVDVWSRPRQSERERSADFLHYRVRLELDLEAQTFRGENHITLRPLAEGYRTCVLDAVDLSVEAVRDGAGRPLSFEQHPTTVEIDLGRARSPDEEVELTVFYRGEGSREGFFFDQETPEHPRMVSTDSWPDEARRWIPCYDHPNDKVTQELLVTVPATEKVLSNGRLVAVTEDPDAGTATWHWFQERPHATYLFMLAVGPFEVIEESLGDLPLSYWVYPRDTEEAPRVFAETPRMIEYYAELFGTPFPWAKYAQVTTPHVGGGAEATSATILGDGVIHDARAAQDFSWERVIAHEIAHQWWGDLVTLRDWPHTWLNEGFATYADYLWTRHRHGDDAGAWDLEGKRRQYFAEARTRYRRPIVFDRYERPHDHFDAHTYAKAACVLHELRLVLGDDDFFGVLRAFLARHAFRSVDTGDFAREVAEVAGRDLGWFFEQSLFLPGHPVFDVRSRYDEGSGELHLEVDQIQDRSHGVPIYRLPLRVGIVTPSERRVETVWLESEHDRFLFRVDERPRLVRFDEGNWLLCERKFEKGVEELVDQARRDDVVGRERAVRELARHASVPSVTEALAALVTDDPFWAVRRSALEVLAANAGAERVELLRAAAFDASSRVRAAALRALGGLADPSQVGFLRARFEADDSYVVQAEALRALGCCGDRSLLPFLERAREQPSHDDVVRRAAEEAIAAIGER